MTLVRLVLLAAALASIAGCALFRPPLTPAERLALDVQRLAAAPTDSARMAVAADLSAQAGLTPLAGRQFTYGRVVAGFVPGRSPLARDTLVVVAAAIDGPYAVPLIAAGRRMVDAAVRRGADPGRSVLVALWPAGRTPERGLAEVLAFPLWPRSAVRHAVVVVPASPETVVPDLFQPPPGEPGAVADAIARHVLKLAASDLFLVPSDTLSTD